MLTEEIKNCRTPQEALLLLADAIDGIRLAVDALQAAPKLVQPADGWGELTWDDTPGQIVAVPARDESRAETQARAQAIAAVQLQLEACTDPEERQALEARLRLLKDTAANVARSVVPEGERAVIESDGTNGSVELPPTSPERQAVRREFAVKLAGGGFLKHLTEEAIVDAYCKGGPMWLYLGNREAVMAMPYGWRQELVAEVARDSAAEALRMGRDVLKHATSISSDTAVQYTDQVAGR